MNDNDVRELIGAILKWHRSRQMSEEQPEQTESYEQPAEEPVPVADEPAPEETPEPDPAPVEPPAPVQLGPDASKVLDPVLARFAEDVFNELRKHDNYGDVLKNAVGLVVKVFTGV